MRNSSMTICFTMGLIWSLAGMVSAESYLYMGQEPPGMTPRIFAPDFISTDHLHQHSITFTPDGKECYYTEHTHDWSSFYIMKTVYQDGAWTPPVKASFSNDQSLSPSISYDGNRLFFCSRRGTPGAQAVWQCTRTAEGLWSEPVEMIREISSTVNEASCHLSDLGNMFVCSWRTGGVGGCDGWRIPCVDGQYQQAQNLRLLNTPSGDCGFVPGPNEAYVVFQSSRPSTSGSGFRGSDLYISFAMPKGGWTLPSNLGLHINCTQNDIGAWISHDGRYLFFSSTREGSTHNLFWVETRAFLPDPNSPIENINNGLRFSSIQYAINCARTGDTIMIEPGIYTENLDVDKDIILTSVDPNDPMVIGGTIIQAEVNEPVLTLTQNSAACMISGLTLRAGSIGIEGTDTDAFLLNCRIMDNVTHGLELYKMSNPILDHCLITGNGQNGITMVPYESRRILHCQPLIKNCIIVENGAAGMEGGEPVVMDSIIQED